MIDFVIPDEIGGRYAVVQMLGRGGMGEVYLARDNRIGRSVAVKMMSSGMDADAIARWMDVEARTVGALQHPNIVTLFDYGEECGRPFIVMEYVRGETLAELIDRTAHLSVVQRLLLVQQVCHGLGHAHEHEIVHRDIKPANVIVDRRSVAKILDFGISILNNDDISPAGSLVGTPAYMAPEALRGESIDKRADLFSVGTLLYEMLTYKRAFPHDFQKRIRVENLNEPTVPLEEVCPDIDPDLGAIVTRALASTPDQRFQTAEELIEQMDRLISRLRAVTSRIFISYRREDASGFALFLHDQLSRRYGASNVFFDVSVVAAGADFVQVVRDNVRACSVFFAIIGPRWLSTSSPRGRRLDDADDLLRIEIETAIKARREIIPILVDGATMPTANDLPEPIRQLARFNALEIKLSSWQHDVTSVVQRANRSLDVGDSVSGEDRQTKWQAGETGQPYSRTRLQTDSADDITSC
jgi:serine/threonine protein kinase